MQPYVACPVKCLVYDIGHARCKWLRQGYTSREHLAKLTAVQMAIRAHLHKPKASVYRTFRINSTLRRIFSLVSPLALMQIVGCRASGLKCWNKHRRQLERPPEGTRTRRVGSRGRQAQRQRSGMRGPLQPARTWGRAGGSRLTASRNHTVNIQSRVSRRWWYAQQAAWAGGQAFAAGDLAQHGRGHKANDH